MTPTSDETPDPADYQPDETPTDQADPADQSDQATPAEPADSAEEEYDDEEQFAENDLANVLNPDADSVVTYRPTIRFN